MPTLYTTLSVKELIGKPLNWAVAKTQGFELYKDEMLNGVTKDGWWISGYYPGDLNSWIPLSAYSPSETYSQGGPILYREIDNYERRVGYFYCNRFRIHNGRPSGSRSIVKQRKDKAAWATGPTLLVASMRCYVSFKLGGEVEIPGELA